MGVGPRLGFPGREGRGFGSSRSWVTRAARLMRLMRLLRASVGPLVTFEMCQLVIWGVQRARPNLLISGGQDSSWRSSASWRVYWRARAGCRSCRCLSRFLSRARLCGLRRGGHQRRGGHAAGFDRGR